MCMKKFTLLVIYGLTCLLTQSLVAQEIKLSRVEPMFWWTGMKDQNLQLMVYGQNIANADVKIETDKIKSFAVQKVKNVNYIFIDILISDNATPGKFDINFSKGKKKVASYSYELKARTPRKHGFSSEDVIYMLMPDRFANGTTANDAPAGIREPSNRKNPNGRHGGDLKGMTDHLDYIKTLGATVVWATPFLENNMDSFSYHGYAITDFYKTDARCGTNDDYALFVNTAHDKGLKIIMDMVFNHIGSCYYWMTDLPTEDWIHQFKEYTRTNYRSESLVDIHALESDKTLLTDGWFDRTMPDLNQKNPFLKTFLIQNTIWWIEFAGIDGIRLDTQPYPDKDMVAAWAKRVKLEFPDFTLLGEAWLQKEAHTAYFQGGARNLDGYNSNMDCVTDFPMYFALTSGLNQNDNWTDGLAKLYYVLSQDFLYSNPNNLVIFADNHDLTRFYNSVNFDINKFKMGIGFLLTTRGIPSLYYGTEILMDEKSGYGDGYKRKDFPGGWANDTINAFTQKGLTAEQLDAYQFVKNICNWRKTKAAITKGKLKQAIPNNETYIYFRYTDNECVMVIMNNSSRETKTINTANFGECLNGYKTGKEIITGQIITNLDKIKIPAKSIMIIDLEK